MPKESGVLITAPLDGDRIVQTKTVRCMHCGRHWVWVKGSGRRRGFCLNCMGITCGDPRCDPCVHWEQRLENAEQGKPMNHKPIIVSVPGLGG